MPDLFDARIDARQITDALDRLARKADNLRPLMRALAADMLDAVHENFEQEGRPDRWAPLAPSTLAALEKKGKTGKMLNRTGAGLWHNIAAESSAVSALVGTNKEYARIHQFGGEAGRKTARVTIPARPYLHLEEDDLAQMAERVLRHFEKP